MIIIFGTRTRKKTVESGDFYCPNCNDSRPYEKKEIAQYFALFFIPLFKMEDLGHYIECQKCKKQFSDAVLNDKPPSPLDQLVEIVRRDLDSGTPIEMARQKLANRNVEPKIAEQALKTAIGTGHYICPNCTYTYRKTVKQCTNCGSQLHLS